MRNKKILMSIFTMFFCACLFMPTSFTNASILKNAPDNKPLQNVWNNDIGNGYYKITNAEPGYERSGINSETSAFVEYGQVIKNSKNGKYDIPNGYEIRPQGVFQRSIAAGDKIKLFAWRKKSDSWLSYKPLNGQGYTRWSGDVKGSNDLLYEVNVAEGQTDRKYISLRNLKSGKFLYKDSDGRIRSDGESSKDKNAQWLFIPYSFLGEMLDENNKPINPAS